MNLAGLGDLDLAQGKFQFVVFTNDGNKFDVAARHFFLLKKLGRLLLR